MCSLCEATHNYDPRRHEPEVTWSEPSFDAEFNPYQIEGTLQVGTQITGRFEQQNEQAYFQIDLTAGETYDFSFRGESSASGTLQDPELIIFDPNGRLISHDDDSGLGYDAEVNFVAAETGQYTVRLQSFEGRSTGTYVLNVDAAERQDNSARLGTWEEMAQFLTDGYWDGQQRYWRSNELTVNVSGLTQEGKALARWAMEAWESVIDMKFTEVSSGGSIVFDDEESGAFARLTRAGDRMQSATINVSKNWLDTYGTDVGSYSLATYIHEIGHVLGLGHQGDYNGSANYGADESFLNDSYQTSIMSYFSQSENPIVYASFARPLTAMGVDIVAAQYFYGTPSAQSASAGNTLWGEGSTVLSYISDPTAGALTVYDVSGNDTFDARSSTAHDFFNMKAQGVSDVWGMRGNVVISHDTLLENLCLGSGNDRAIGNHAANRIEGGSGNDQLMGAEGGDLLYGDLGNDLLLGQSGADRLFGGEGADRLEGGSSTDHLEGGAGHDSVLGGTGNDTLYGGEGDDLLYGNSALDTIYGGLGDDYISAGDGVDLVYGNEGDDILHGRSGWDRLHGGSGKDRIFGSSGDDYLDGGNDDDWLSGGSASDILKGGGGNDTLYGNFGSDELYGNGGDDVLYGGTGDDLLEGGRGADTLYGNQGLDILIGGQGNDVLRGGTLQDVFIFDLGHGQDRITDFEVKQDLLHLSHDLVDGLHLASEVIAQFGSLTSDGFLLSFNEENTILFESVSSGGDLLDNIYII